MSGDNPNAPESLNVLVRILLRTPLHWFISHNTMLLWVTGRKTGKVYNIPVSYTRDGKIWWSSPMRRGGRTCARRG